MTTNRAASKTAFAEQLTELLRTHAPHLTDEDESQIYLAIATESDIADLAIRTCTCGKRIDGFYAYADHLQEVAGGPPITGA